MTGFCIKYTDQRQQWKVGEKLGDCCVYAVRDKGCLDQGGERGGGPKTATRESREDGLELSNSEIEKGPGRAQTLEPDYSAGRLGLV